MDESRCGVMSLDIEPLESPVCAARQDVARSVLTGVADFWPEFLKCHLTASGVAHGVIPTRI